MVGEWRETRAERERVHGYDIEKSIEGLDWMTTFWGIVDSTSAVVQQTKCPYSTLRMFRKVPQFSQSYLISGSP